MSDYSGQQGDTLVLEDHQTERELKEPRRVRVLLLNDDYTSMEFVVLVLMDIFRKTSQEATTIMLAVHENGRGECGVYTLEIAETKVGQVHSRAREHGFPLRCVVEDI
ncbi:MAG: ATP-dependent Clp protease adapter ClpS [Deltaproteobacteria bacterium]|jgi:ATP-dependent Clp protease adaptor protein ClpS|nr:ATP-dependent Clp protease adapter ClpS [Deltaproteobacteria bacterium]